MAMSILYPSSHFNYGGVPGQESKLFYLPGKLFYSDTDAAAAGAAAGAVAAASAVCIYYVFIGGALRAPLYVHNGGCVLCVVLSRHSPPYWETLGR